MNIFAIEKGKAQKLEVDNYEELTKKRFPYYQFRRDKKLLHFAICPECGNPIQILNLFGPEMMQNKTRIVKAYAKHTRGKKTGFYFWNENDKKNCRLYKPSPLGNTEIKHNDEYSNELKEIIETHKKEIYKDIRGIIGVNLSNTIMEQLYEVFMNSGAYGYKAITKYNIPYAILYYQKSISLYKQYVKDSDFGKEIAYKINMKSKFFDVKEKGFILKNAKGFRTINLILTHFKQDSTNQSAIVEIFETSDDNNTYTIFKKKIDFKPFIYN